MGWAYGLTLTGDENDVESWEGDFPTDREAHSAARALHGPDGDVIVAWVDRLTYAAMMPTAQTLLGDMRDRAAEGGGDLTCFDNLAPEDVLRLDGELRALVEIWQEELPADKQSTAVTVRNRKRFPPLPLAGGQ